MCYSCLLTSSSTKHIKDKFAHLTNYSINKHSEDFEQSEEGDSGSKWTLTALKKYFADNNMDDTELWVNVKDLIVKTVISAEDTVISTTSRYIKSKYVFKCLC
jgi:phosphoenolpyruvate carboxylase